MVRCFRQLCHILELTKGISVRNPRRATPARWRHRQPRRDSLPQGVRHFSPSVCLLPLIVVCSFHGDLNATCSSFLLFSEPRLIWRHRPRRHHRVGQQPLPHRHRTGMPRRGDPRVQAWVPVQGSRKRYRKGRDSQGLHRQQDVRSSRPYDSRERR